MKKASEINIIDEFNMQKVVAVYKPVGLTPLQTVLAFKKKFPDYASAKISYAGRLDPMADGVLLLLIGDANKKRSEYETLDKVYKFSMVCGVATDTYDLLGMITNFHTMPLNQDTLKEKISHELNALQGNHIQSYPPFSSMTVKGKPLYWWSRENRLSEITIPTKKIKVSESSLLSIEKLSKQSLYTYIDSVIPMINGSFRQNEILKLWQEKRPVLLENFVIVHCQITCSSGTYIRGIVQELGTKIGVPITTYCISRIKAGEFSIEGTIKV